MDVNADKVESFPWMKNSSKLPKAVGSKREFEEFLIAARCFHAVPKVQQHSLLGKELEESLKDGVVLQAPTIDKVLDAHTMHRWELLDKSVFFGGSGKGSICGNGGGGFPIENIVDDLLGISTQSLINHNVEDPISTLKASIPDRKFQAGFMHRDSMLVGQLGSTAAAITCVAVALKARPITAAVYEDPYGSAKGKISSARSTLSEHTAVYVDPYGSGKGEISLTGSTLSAHTAVYADAYGSAKGEISSIGSALYAHTAVYAGAYGSARGEISSAGSTLSAHGLALTVGPPSLLGHTDPVGVAGSGLEQQRGNIFAGICYIYNKRCSFIIDSGSSSNIIRESLIPELGLSWSPLPSPMSLTLMDRKQEVQGFVRAWVPFSMQNYADCMWFVALANPPADLILGTPWGYDVHAVLHFFENQCKFQKNGVDITLNALAPNQVAELLSRGV